MSEKLSTVINNPSRHVKRKRKGKENFPPAPPIEKREGERKEILVFPSNAPARTRTRARMRTREAQQLDEDLGDDDEELDGKAASDLYFGHRKKILDFFKVQ